MLTTGDLIRALSVHDYYIYHGDLAYVIKQLKIKLKSKVVAGMKITAYLTAADVREVLKFWDLDITRDLI